MRSSHGSKAVVSAGKDVWHLGYDRYLASGLKTEALCLKFRELRRSATLQIVELKEMSGV